MQCDECERLRQRAREVERCRLRWLKKLVKCNLPPSEKIERLEDMIDLAVAVDDDANLDL